MRTLQAILAALALGCCLAGTGFAADKFRVEIEAGARPASDADLRDAAGDDSLQVVQRGARTIVETDAAGYKKLLADHTLQSVRLVGGPLLDDSGPRSGKARETDSIEFTIRLNTGAVSGDRAALNMSDAQRAAASAQITSRKRLKAFLLPAGEGGPGMLVVRALDNGGRELSRAVIDDPRLLRAEAGPGRPQQREDYVRANVQVNVTLAYHVGMARLTISDFNSGGEKQIATLAAR